MFFQYIFCISENYIKFWIFTKKDEPHSLFIAEIIDMSKSQKHSQVYTAVSLSYSLVNLKKVQFQKFFLSSIWNLETIC